MTATATRTTPRRPKPKEKLPARVSKRGLAMAMGVSERTIDRWRAEPTFPDADDGLFDLAAVEEWRTTWRGSTENSQEATRLQLQLKRELLTMKRLERKRMQRQEALAAGDMLDRHVYEAHLAETIVHVRELIYNAPRALVNFVPGGPEAKAIYREEAELYMRRALEELARRFEEGPELEVE